MKNLIELDMTLESMKRDHVLFCLEQNNGNRLKTAQMLNVSPRIINIWINIWKHEGYDVPEPAERYRRNRTKTDDTATS